MFSLLREAGTFVASKEEFSTHTQKKYTTSFEQEYYITICVTAKRSSLISRAFACFAFVIKRSPK